MSNNGAVAIYNKIDDPMAAMETLGAQVAESGIFGGNNPGLGRVMALTCICEGLTPIEFSRKYHVIKGQLSMKSDHMLAAYLADGGKCTWINIGDDGTEARALWEYGNNKMEIGYSIDEAKRAGLVKESSNWTKNPGSMLRARCQTKAIRIIHPAISAGIYSPEEIEGVDVRSNGPPSPIDTLAMAKQAADMAEGQETIIKVIAEMPETVKKKEPQSPATMATAEDTDEIRHLYERLKVPIEAQEKALTNRKVNTLRSLTHGQCLELIEKLSTKARTLGIELEDWAANQSK